MGVREKIRILFRLFLLLTILVAVALVSAVTTIRLTIQGRQETLPNFVGVPLEKAQRLASGLGLEIAVEDKLFSTQYPTDAIVSQIPPQGTRIKAGQRIHVLVSLGPPRLAIPNLVGITARVAQITAIQRGLIIGDVAVAHSATAEPDQVFAQDPPPLTTEIQRPTVNLLISLGQAPPDFLCPNFIGQHLPDARRALESHGFKVGEVTPMNVELAAPGTILDQSPTPGSMITQDATFNFHVSQ